MKHYTFFYEVPDSPETWESRPSLQLHVHTVHSDSALVK